MEPIPPAGLDYNSFRRWRTSNGIRGSKEENQEVWKTYKDGVTSTIPVSPPRPRNVTSRKSPTSLPKQKTPPGRDGSSTETLRRSPRLSPPASRVPIPMRLMRLGSPQHPNVRSLSKKSAQRGISPRARELTHQRKTESALRRQKTSLERDRCVRPLDVDTIRRALDGGILPLPISISDGVTVSVFTPDGAWRVEISDDNPWWEVSVRSLGALATVKDQLRAERKVVDFLSRKRVLQARADCNQRHPNYSSRMTRQDLVVEMGDFLRFLFAGNEPGSNPIIRRAQSLIRSGDSTRVVGEYTLRLRETLDADWLTQDVGSSNSVWRVHSRLLEAVLMTTMATSDLGVARMGRELLRVEGQPTDQLLDSMETVLVLLVRRLHALYVSL